MVNLRSKPETQTETQDQLPDIALTPPSPDLMDHLHKHFACTLPEPGPAGRIAEQVAEMRGNWQVINYMQSIIDAQQAQYQENRP